MMNPGVSLPILTYHSVGRSATGDMKRYTVSREQFDEHVCALIENDWKILPLLEAAAAVTCGETPRQSVVLTVDDGYEDFLTGVLPILEKHRATVALYVSTAHVGGTATWLSGVNSKRVLMDWETLGRLPEDLVEIGSHGHRHLGLDLLPPEVARAEVIRSRQLLEERLGLTRMSFAYPFGYQSRRVRGHVQEAGFAAACTVFNLPMVPGDSIYNIPRLIASSDLSGDGLLALVKGAPGEVTRRATWARQRVWSWSRRASVPRLLRAGHASRSVASGAE
jgi:peptidoglycan/xylan/chitin deacetylase (PgdA/CDA1 family)